MAASGGVPSLDRARHGLTMRRRRRGLSAPTRKKRGAAVGHRRHCLNLRLKRELRPLVVCGQGGVQLRVVASQLPSIGGIDESQYHKQHRRAEAEPEQRKESRDAREHVSHGVYQGRFWITNATKAMGLAAAELTRENSALASSADKRVRPPHKSTGR